MLATVHRITQDETLYPRVLLKRLGAAAPEQLTLVGNVDLLAHNKTALFCSARTPGDAILRTFDTVRRFRDDGVTVISGFHSPIEKECLHILLRGRQPIINLPGACYRIYAHPLRMSARVRGWPPSLSVTVHWAAEARYPGICPTPK
ncbi:MAG: hypothetical protein D9V47_00315 [Clostridia bacterium]|nr:MAG: hypothetical protein D9V47_00315 [Clostridia bacterium]